MGKLATELSKKIVSKEDQEIKRLSRFRRWRYGISVEELLARLAKAGNACEVCGQSIRLTGSRGGDTACVDHDHKTGKVRGVLCVKCNSALGKFKDSPELLTRAIQYLTRVCN